MVAETGEEFYAEIPFPYNVCSGFVREVVIPLLNKLPLAYCPRVELGMRIISWIKLVKRRDEDVEICFDFQTDWDLFAASLDNRIPPWCKARNVGSNISELLRYEYHKKNNLPEHHALYDAQANRYAFRQLPSLIG